MCDFDYEKINVTVIITLSRGCRQQISCDTTFFHENSHAISSALFTKIYLKIFGAKLSQNVATFRQRYILHHCSQRYIFIESIRLLFIKLSPHLFNTDFLRCFFVFFSFFQTSLFRSYLLVIVYRYGTLITLMKNIIIFPHVFISLILTRFYGG